MPEIIHAQGSIPKESGKLITRTEVAHYSGDIEEAVGPFTRRMERVGRRLRPRGARHLVGSRAWGARVLEARGARLRQAWLDGHEPDEIYVGEGNLLMYGGASCLWECLLGNGTGTADQTLTYFNNANAAIGVGNSNTAAVATHNDLQGASKVRVVMDATYPQHSDGTTSGAASVTWRATFGTSVGNFPWEEWCIANSPDAATGRMLNRLVEANGTKSGGTTTFTVTTAIA